MKRRSLLLSLGFLLLSACSLGAGSTDPLATATLPEAAIPLHDVHLRP